MKPATRKLVLNQETLKNLTSQHIEGNAPTDQCSDHCPIGGGSRPTCHEPCFRD